MRSEELRQIPNVTVKQTSIRTRRWAPPMTRGLWSVKVNLVTTWEISLPPAERMLASRGIGIDNYGSASPHIDRG